MKLAFCTGVLAACVLGIGVEASALAQDTSAKQDMRDAAKSTERAAKKVGYKGKEEVEKGSERWFPQGRRRRGQSQDSYTVA